MGGGRLHLAENLGMGASSVPLGHRTCKCVASTIPPKKCLDPPLSDVYI